jgi:hypothetical protein
MVWDLQHHVDKDLLDSCGTIIDRVYFARLYFYATCMTFFKLIIFVFLYLISPPMQYGDRKWQYNIFYSRLFIFYYYYFFPRRLQMQSQLLGFPILVAIEHGLKKLELVWR